MSARPVAAGESPLGAAARAALERLARGPFAAVEVYEKRGRSRCFELEGERESVSAAEEEGWAVRAGGAERSCFATGTGAPPPDLELPEATAHALRLPEPRPVPPFAAPADLDAPLATEAEAWALFAGFERGVRAEIPTARLVAARLEDGASEGFLISSRGVEAASRARAAALRFEIEAGGARCVLEVAERDPRRFRPSALARRAVDRLLARQAGDGVAAGEMVLAAPLAARLLEALAPLFVGAGAEARLAAFWDGERRIASREVTLLDDGRDLAGALAAPVDGEGLPTGELRLIERGRFVAPLLAWWEARGAAPPGCARRARFRDLPRRAPTQMRIESDPAVAPADLAGAVERGVYLIDAEGGVRWDVGVPRFRVAVAGFALEAGRAVAPLGPCWLEGDPRALLTGVRAVARDLAWASGDGLYGAPTLLASGLTLTPAAA